jgi:hypothetical protein
LQLNDGFIGQQQQGPAGELDLGRGENVIGDIEGATSYFSQVASRSFVGTDLSNIRFRFLNQAGRLIVGRVSIMLVSVGHARNLTVFADGGGIWDPDIATARRLQTAELVSFWVENQLLAVVQLLGR